jgi:hypothetical protein
LGIRTHQAHLSQVEVVFDADEPRIHYFFDAPQFFRKQAIMRIET